ncbi:hypothetical protein KAI56_03895 [Candidatus Parcubacteria bacterium]|nr:hypothetical protein [Candidatus Parcubacteria bacterium]
MMRVPIKEEDFPKLFVKIKGIWFEGRDIYGFFLKEKEFQEIAEDEFLNDGYLGPLNFKTDVIHLMTSEDSSKLSKEYLQQIERGEFIVGNEPDITGKIKRHNLPVRKIKFWHGLGWSFKT